MLRSLRFSTLLATAVVALGCEGRTGREMPQVGRPVPEYSARSLAGDSVSLAGMRGSVVLLNIWATWCAPCRDELPVLQALYDQYRERGFEIVGVSVDQRGEQRAIQRFIDDYGLTYPIWHDPEERVTSTFFAIGVPATYLVDRDGTLRWQRVGPVHENDPSLIPALEAALGTPGE